MVYQSLKNDDCAEAGVVMVSATVVKAAITPLSVRYESVAQIVILSLLAELWFVRVAARPEAK